MKYFILVFIILLFFCPAFAKNHKEADPEIILPPEPVAEAPVSATETAAGIPAESYRSPSTAFVYSQMKLLPVVNFFSQGGTSYSFLPMQDTSRDAFGTAMTALGDISILACYGTLAYGNSSSAEPLLYTSLGFFSVSYFYDLFISNAVSTENAENYIKSLKSRDLTPDPLVYTYKEPLLAAGISIFSPALSCAYTGDNTGALIWAGFDMLGWYSAYQVATAEINAPSDPGGYDSMFGAWSLILTGTMAAHIANIFISASSTDIIDAKYFRQVLIRERKHPSGHHARKDRDTAVVNSLLLGNIVPGAGNLYAGNMDTFGTILGFSILGGGMVGAASLVNPEDNTSRAVKYLGIAIYVGARLADVFTAPGNVSIYNALYTDETYNRKKSKFSIAPMVAPNMMGLNLVCSY